MLTILLLGCLLSGDILEWDKDPMKGGQLQRANKDPHMYQLSNRHTPTQPLPRTLLMERLPRLPGRGARAAVQGCGGVSRSPPDWVPVGELLSCSPAARSSAVLAMLSAQ